MQFWTHHPSAFPLDSPALEINPDLGKYYVSQGAGYRYSEVLEILVAKLRTRNFLWCCAKQGQFRRMSNKDDLVGWELNVPESQVISLYNEAQWEELVWSHSDTWDGLLLPVNAELIADGIGALVRVPFEDSNWAISHGQVPAKYP